MIKKYRYTIIRAIIPTAWTPKMLKSMQVRGEIKKTDYVRRLVAEDVGICGRQLDLFA